MKLKSNLNTLADAFNSVAPATASRNAKPVLQSVKLIASGGKIELQATDTETWVTTSIPADIEVDGVVLIPAGRFSAILKESTEEEISLEVTTDTLIVSTSRSEFRLPTANADEFPSAKPFPEGGCIEIGGRALAAVVQRTVFCCDPTSSRFALGGVNWELVGGKMNVVGTDGRRLAHATVDVSSTGDAPFKSGIITVTALTLAARLLSSGELPVQISGTDNDVVFRCGDTIVWSRLVEGRFPNWRQVIPDIDEYDIDQNVPCNMLASAFRQAAVVADAETRGISLLFKGTAVRLSSSCQDVGKSSIDMTLANECAETKVRVDYRYVLDFLKACAEESCRMLVVSGTRPVVFKTTDYTYVVMPMSEDAV